MGWRDAARAAPIALAALAGAAGAGGRGPPDEVCELARADRARMPSTRCVACHEEILIGPARAGHGDHPVDVDYAAIAARDPEAFVPPALLRKDVPLVDGKVACTSCHDGASPHARRAVDPANLCSACHRL